MYPDQRFSEKPCPEVRTKDKSVETAAARVSFVGQAAMACTGDADLGQGEDT